MPFSSGAFLAAGLRIPEPPGDVMDDRAEALVYRSTAEGMWPWLLRPFARRALACLPPGGSIVDLGTGPGLMPCYWARTRPDARVVGVDLSRPMLELARERARLLGVDSRAGFVRADAADTGLPAASFDVVISHYALHHFDDPGQLIAEAARLVRPGGTVLLRDMVRPSPLMARMLLAWSAVLARRSREQNRQYAESLAAGHRPAEVREMLRRRELAGFAVAAGPIHLEVFRGPSARRP